MKKALTFIAVFLFTATVTAHVVPAGRSQPVVIEDKGFTSKFASSLERLNMPCEASGVPGKYDERMRRAVKRYWSIERRAYHCVLKAQAWTESDFREDVVSPVGAEGLFQFMPHTWEEWKHKVNLPGAKAKEAGASIRAGAAYMEWLQDRWLWNRTEKCRIELALASYNAGMGNIIKAQRESGMAVCWNDGISDALPRVTGHHAKETQDYVHRITTRYETLTGSEW